MLANLYEYIIHAVLVLGIISLIAGWVLGFIPFIGRYKLPIQVLGVILFSTGLWFEGSIAKDKEWGQRVAKLEAQLAEARVESGKVTTEIVTKVVKERQVIKEKGEKIIEYIDREVAQSDSTCNLSDRVILSHNAAAKNDPTLLREIKPSDEVGTKDHNDLAKSKLKLAPKK